MRRFVIPAFMVLLVAGIFIGHRFLRIGQPTLSPDAAAYLDIKTWKTCRNERAGYQLRYPADWYILTEDAQETTVCSGDDLTLSSLPGKILSSVTTQKELDDLEATGQLIYFNVRSYPPFNLECEDLNSNSSISEDNPGSSVSINGETFKIYSSNRDYDITGQHECRVYDIGTNASIPLRDALLSSFRFL